MVLSTLDDVKASVVVDTPTYGKAKAPSSPKKAKDSSHCWRASAKWVAFFTTLIGVAMGCRCEGYDVVTSLYVNIQILTTVGYGDITVQSDNMKLFASVYMVIALMTMASWFSSASSLVVQAHVDRLRKRLHTVAKLRHEEGEDEEKATTNARRLCFAVTVLWIGAGTVFFRLYEQCTCSYGVTAVPGCKEVNYDVCVKTGGYTQNWHSAFYMSIATLTTVGFGDHAPKTWLGRIFASAFMLFGVSSMGNFLSAYGDYLFNNEEELADHQNLSVDIDEDIFAEVDTDGDGTLSRDEYRAYVLMKHGLVNKDVLDSIDNEFAFLLGEAPQLTWEAIKARSEEIGLRRAARSEAKGKARRRTHVVPVRQASKRGL